MTADPKSVLSHGLVQEPTSGAPLLDPADVRAGVDRGDGVLGTLRPYPSTEVEDVDDALVALRQLLLETQEIVARCDTRVYSKYLPGAKRELLPCILIQRLGGNDDPEMPTVINPLYDVRVFGRTLAEAYEIYSFIKRRNGRRAMTTNFLFHTLEETIGATDRLQPVADSIVFESVFAQWTAEISRAD